MKRKLFDIWFELIILPYQTRDWLVIVGTFVFLAVIFFLAGLTK